MVTAATVGSLVASVLDPEVAECQEDDILPNSVDWAEAGAVTTLKNQENCGNCYAHSTVGSIESLHKIKNGILLDLSIQQVADCAPGCFGCDGGSSFMALMYLSSAGVSLASTYPRRLDKWHGDCRFRIIKPAVRIEGFSRTDMSEEDLMRAVAKQPVVVVLSISNDNEHFNQYKGGVLEHAKLPTEFRGGVLHAVLVVRYGVDEVTGVPFWKIKNSYGPKWGQNGYFRIRRNAPERLGTGGIRGSIGFYPLFADNDNDPKRKIYRSGLKTRLDVIVEKQFDPAN